MKQTGTFYTLTNNANGTETKSPLPNIYIYFSQKGVRKLTTQTSKAGKFDFDLPLGDYNVTYSQGASHNVYNLAGGSTFSLTASSAVNEFEKWAMTPVYLKPEENPLVIRLAELAKIATDAATEAKAIQDELNSNSIGSGKWMKEGAYGLGSSLMTTGTTIQTVRDRLNNRTGICVNNHDDSLLQYSYVIYAKHSVEGYDSTLAWGHSSNRLVQVQQRTPTGIRNINLYSDQNTTVDSNGNIKAASPIIKLFNDHIESNDSFKEKPIFEKMSTGVYKITNTLGLSKNGWTHNIPLNSNGRGYFRVRVEHLEDGCIVRVFRVKNVLNPDTFEIDVVDGDPIDIGKDQRWIDLRFHEEPQEADDEELLTQPDNLDESAH